MQLSAASRRAFSAIAAASSPASSFGLLRSSCRAFSVAASLSAAMPPGGGGGGGGSGAPGGPRGPAPGPAAPPRPQGIVDASGSVVKGGPPSSNTAAGPVDKAKAAKDRRDRHEAMMKAAATPPPSPIVDVNPSNFQREVLESPVPVILDAWANWCGPCKQLSPMLEQIVLKSGGLFKLAMLEADAEENQALAAQLNIRSLPTVFGVVKGKVVDSFTGLQSPQRLQQFFTALAQAAQTAGIVPSPSSDPASAAVQSIAEASAAVDDGDAAFALEVLPSTLETLQKLYTALHRRLGEEAMEKAAAEKKEPLPVRSDVGPLADVDNLLARGYAVMLRALLAEAQRGIAATSGSSPSGPSSSSSSSSAAAPSLLPPDECFRQVHAFYDMLTSKRFAPYHKDELVARGVSAGSLAKNAEESISKLSPLLKAHQANPSDPDARFNLAEALASSGNAEAAMDHLLALVKTAPSWKDGLAKATLLKLLDTLGTGSPIAVRGRRALSKLLFR